jgi:streptogramin lyase
MIREQRAWSLGLALFFVAALWACSDETSPGPILCSDDSDCPEGMSCLDDICRTDCVTSTDCPEGMQCISGHCLTPCTGDSDCPPGEECENGFCQPVQVQDGGDGDGDGGINQCIDEDGDGYGDNCALGDDCDDSERTTHPGAPEVCHDNIDNDCDDLTDEADCGCERGDRRACYTGSIETKGVGLCRSGIMICGDDKEYGDCMGEQVPVDEVCDLEDNDCDGSTDEDLYNACGVCPEPGEPDPLVEICGDGLDNNCDDQVDENCSCDPNCQCDQGGSGSNCECHPPVGQPCYSGPPHHLGKGICVGGTHDCVPQDDDYVWTACEGEVLAGVECDGDLADGQDNDCDGFIDEDCLPDLDNDGYRPPEDCNDNDPEVNPGEVESCNGIDDDCNGIVDDGVTNACGTCGAVPDEVCGDGLDNDCDGSVDEMCGGCSGTEEKQCYRGPDGTQGIGTCQSGLMTCIDGEFWSECIGDVIPEPEVCDGADNDCDDEIDELWAIGSNACGFCDSTEVCDGVDNDCDGWTDEGVANPCGECAETPLEVCDGVDNDCDGLTDEDVLTACGTCPDVACYEQEWDTPGHCDDPHRECNGTEPDPGDPDSITLGQGTSTTPFIYVAVNAQDEVAKLDTVTGEKIWQVPSHGDDPSRTAVALDFSVWVGNRGSGSINNPDYSNGVHLDADGNLICRVDAIGRCRGVAIDGDGNVWFGTWEGQTVYKVHGTNVNDTDCAAPPCCEVLDTINVGTSIYGLAVDGNGYLWSASGTAHTHTTNNTIRLNTATGAFDLVSNPSWYGIAISPVDGKIWYGNWWGTGCVHSLEPNPPYTVANSAVCGGNVTGVTVDRFGYVWASSHNQNKLFKINPDDGSILCDLDVPMTGPGATDARGVAIDSEDKVWVVQRLGGYAHRYFPDCTFDATFEVESGSGMYTYSDMTGMQLRIVTTREGHWIQNFDTGYEFPIWHSANWEATTPPGTAVTLTFTSADSEAELVTNPSPACGPFSAPPADLSACAGLQGHRWLSVDVHLTTNQDGVRPTFSGLSVLWSY